MANAYAQQDARSGSFQQVSESKGKSKSNAMAKQSRASNKQGTSGGGGLRAALADFSASGIIEYGRLANVLRLLANSPGEESKLELGIFFSATALKVLKGDAEANIQCYIDMSDTNKIELGIEWDCLVAAGIDFKLFGVRAGARAGKKWSGSILIKQFHNHEDAAIQMMHFFYDLAGALAAKTGVENALKVAGKREELPAIRNDVNASSKPSTAGLRYDKRKSSEGLFGEFYAEDGPVGFKGGYEHRHDTIQLSSNSTGTFNVHEHHSIWSGSATFNVMGVPITVNFIRDRSDTKGSPYLYENGVFRDCYLTFTVPVSTVKKEYSMGEEDLVALFLGAYTKFDSALKGVPKLRKGVFNTLFKAAENAIAKSQKGMNFSLVFDWNEFGEGDAADVEEHNLMYIRSGFDIGWSKEAEASLQGGALGGSAGAKVSATHREFLTDLEIVGHNTTSYIQRQYLYQRGAGKQRIEPGSVFSYDDQRTTWHKFVNQNQNAIAKLLVTIAEPSHRYHVPSVAAALNLPDDFNCSQVSCLDDDELDELLLSGLPALERHWLSEDYHHRSVMVEMAHMGDALSLYNEGQITKEDAGQRMFQVIKKYKNDHFKLEHIITSCGNYSVPLSDVAMLINHCCNGSEYAELMATHLAWRAEQQCMEMEYERGAAKETFNELGDRVLEMNTAQGSLDDAQAAYNLGNVKEAFRNLRGAESSNDFKHLIEVGKRYCKWGDCDSGLRVFERALQIKSTAASYNTVGYLIWKNLHREQKGTLGDKVLLKAIAYCDQSVKMRPTPHGYNNLGIMYWDCVRDFGIADCLTNARLSFQKAIELGHHSAFDNLAALNRTYGN